MTTSLITLESPEPTAITLPRMSRPVTAAPLVDFTEQFNIPVNLADWLGQKTLATAVTEVTHAVNERQLQPVFSLNDRRLLHPWAMLTLITYSYAVGLYGSGEIAHRLMHDETFQGLFSHECWDANLIRRFRDHNRDLIQQCLEKVCLLAWAGKFGRSQAQPVTATVAIMPVRVHPLFKIQMICDVRTRIHCADQADLLATAA